MEVDQSKLGKADAADAVDRAIEIIRNRVDQFGVAEPLIQKEAGNRIVIQLPGMNDPERAKSLIGQTALLEFKLVRTPQEHAAVFQKIDDFLRTHPVTVPGEGATKDSLASGKQFSSLILSSDKGGAFFQQSDLPRVYAVLDAVNKDSTIVPIDSQLLWGEENDTGNGRTGRWLYMVKKEPDLNGGIVASAIARVGIDPSNPTGWGVSLTLTGPGRNEFSSVTGRYVNRQLAIVLDDKVRSAPVVHERIRGDAQITGNFTDLEAKDLAIVLKAGSLPAPVRIIEERSVGPTLGSDSIRKGLTAALVGAAMVALFMVIYYQLSGVIAVVAMLLNVIILLAFMPILKATLTLPGLAGIVLTIGVSVDANVLIFERIREEIRNKKTITAAVVAGYNRAWLTILDAHVTAFLSALCLYMFGTGPIRGFAVTFSVGLVANLFTAVFLTRYVFDAMTARKRLTSLSI
jgi:SecD/SecF fusion protein